MKKKRIELNQKLFLNKERIAPLSNSDGRDVLGGGFQATDNGTCHIKPATIDGCKPQVEFSGAYAGICNFAASNTPTACQATGNLACNTIAGKCANGLSGWGNLCVPG